MAKVRVKFALGIEEPAKIGTVYLRSSPSGLLAYAQNIDVQNDEYGRGAAVPGPALQTITGNASITGSPIGYVKLSSGSANSFENIIFFEGGVGATNKLRGVQGFKDGGTPAIDTGAAANLTVDHQNAGVDTGHTGIVINDIVLVADDVIMIGYDNTDIWLQKIDVNHTGSNLSFTYTDQIVITTPSSTKLNIHHLLLADNGAIYGNRSVFPDNFIWKLASDLTTYTATVLTLPDKHYVTAMANFRLNAVFAYCTIGQGEFGLRNVGGRSGIIIWDLTPNTSFNYDIFCQANYISALVNTPDGRLLAFGGLNEGRTTIYEFNGFGFDKWVSYIGDMPRSNHSVDFDGQGRVVWLTCDGQLCRYDRRSDTFEHLGSVATNSDAGGMLTKLLGVGNEFLAGSGTTTGPAYVMKRVTFGNYLGDGDTADGITTPLVISAPIIFDTRVKINHIELVLNGPLVSGDNLELRLYKNGNATYINYGDDINSTNDGTVVSSVRREASEPDVSMAHVGVAFKATDARATSPGVIDAIIDYDPMEN